MSLKTLRRSRKSSKLRLSLVGDVEKTMQIRSLKGLAWVRKPSVNVPGHCLGDTLSQLSQKLEGGSDKLQSLPPKCWITGVCHHDRFPSGNLRKLMTVVALQGVQARRGESLKVGHGGLRRDH